MELISSNKLKLKIVPFRKRTVLFNAIICNRNPKKIAVEHKYEPAKEIQRTMYWLFSEDQEMFMLLITCAVFPAYRGKGLRMCSQWNVFRRSIYCTCYVVLTSLVAVYKVVVDWAFREIAIRWSVIAISRRMLWKASSIMLQI